jgi:hypothetical protein
MLGGLAAVAVLCVLVQGQGTHSVESASLTQQLGAACT